MRAVTIHAHGGPEVISLDELLRPEPEPGEILIRHEAVGLNFIDVYQRTGLYPGSLPAILGREAAGVVEAVGKGVTRFRPGDRAGYCTEVGAYADFAAVKETRAVKLPPEISSKVAAAAMLKGMTACVLATRLWPLKPLDTVLVHAAAGGVGTILCQWLDHLGMRVIGTVGSPAKAEYAKAHGCSETILYSEADVAARVRELTGGTGARVVYDSVGKATFETSLASVAKRGLFVTYGNASGPVPAFEPLRLARAGSLFMTRPTLFDWIGTVEELDATATDLFHVIATGAVKVEIGQEFSLNDARKAHEALESRRTTGATVLIP